MLLLATPLHSSLMQPVESCCAANFYATFLKALFIIKIALKLGYFCKKMQNFRALGAQTPVLPAAGGFSPIFPLAFGSWGLRPQIPKTAPFIANFWLRAWTEDFASGPPSIIATWIALICSTCRPIATFFEQDYLTFVSSPLAKSWLQLQSFIRCK